MLEEMKKELRKVKFEGQLVQAAQRLADRLLVCVERCRPNMESCLGTEGVRLCGEATRAFTRLSSHLLHDQPSSSYMTSTVMRDFRRRGDRMVIDLMLDDFVERVVMHEKPPLAAAMLTALVCLLEQEGVRLDEAVGRVLDSVMLLYGKSEYLADYILCFFESQRIYDDEMTIYNTILGALMGDLDEEDPIGLC